MPPLEADVTSSVSSRRPANKIFQTMFHRNIWWVENKGFCTNSVPSWCSDLAPQTFIRLHQTLINCALNNFISTRNIILQSSNPINLSPDSIHLSPNFAFHKSKRINSSTKIFVTGGTGFLGAYIIKELVQKGYHIRAMRRNHQLPFFVPANVFNKVEWLDGDILNADILENAMEGMDAVIHSAAKVSFVADQQQSMFKTNIEGTANVVNAALLKNVKRFVHISSVASLGRTSNGETVTEKKQWEDNDTNTNYAISKYHAEMEVWRGIGEGLDAVIINPSTILGYGDWNNSSCAIFKNVYNEFPWYSNGVNGFVAVEDVARATVLLMESGISNERFIVNADNWSFRQLFNSMAAAFGKKLPHKEATPALAAIAWRAEKVKSFFSGKASLLTKESARIAQTATYFDNSKICRALPGFAFTQIDTVVKNACEHYLQNL